MNYTMTKPCDNCPFVRDSPLGKSTSKRRLEEFASGEFPCHKTAVLDEESGDYLATKDSLHCAGMLIYLEKRGRSTQMMRICERFGDYDHRKLDMTANVR